MLAPEMQKLAGLRVMTAGDDARFSAQLLHILQQLGADAVGVNNGVDALQMLVARSRRHVPLNYLLINLSLPRMDGLSVIRSVRENPALQNLTVIALWRDADLGKLAESRTLGVAADLRLPANPADAARLLLEMVLRAEERRQEEAQAAGDVHPRATSRGFPYLFGGLPRPRNYALRPAFYRCPFCETTFTAPRLVTRALKPNPVDYMRVGLYSGGMERDFLEYLLIECFSCPECLYTFDRSGFYANSVNGESPLQEIEAVPLKDWKPVFFTVNSRLQDTVRNATDARLEVAVKASQQGHGLFAISDGDPTIPRTPEDALIAYDLARMSAEAILPSQQKGEEQARLHHKISGFYVKQYYIHGMRAAAARAAGDTAAAAHSRQAQGASLLAALAAVNQVRDVEFNVLEECLYCQTRRFFIADLLCASTTSQEQKDGLSDLRKRAFAAMKGTLIRVRQEKDSVGVRTVERFMLPLENRMLELEKEKEKESV